MTIGSPNRPRPRLGRPRPRRISHLAPALLVSLLGWASPMAAQSPAVPASEASWVRFAGNVLGGSLRDEIAASASPAQRASIRRASIEIKRHAAGDLACRYPTNLAQVEEQGADFRVQICANNLRNMEFMARQWFAAQLMPYRAYSGTDMLGNYIRLLAGELHLQRRATPDAVRYPCSLRYFIYLSRNRLPSSACTASPDEGRDDAYRRWSTSNSGLVDWPRVREVKQAQGASNLTDDQFLSEMESTYVRDSAGTLLLFATAHEFGHVAYGHVDKDVTTFCGRFHRELAADEFAVRFLERRGLQGRTGLSLAHLPWFFLGLNARAFSEAGAMSDAFATARIKTILKGLQASAETSAASIPPGAVQWTLKDFAQHPDLNKVLGELEARSVCAEMADAAGSENGAAARSSAGPSSTRRATDEPLFLAGVPAVRY
jgi:hypothetical protein